MRPGKLHCPICSSAELYHSQSREFIDLLMAMVGKRPFRCKICNRRFHAPEPEAPDTDADAPAANVKKS